MRLSVIYPFSFLIQYPPQENVNARARGQFYSLPCGDDRQTTVFSLARCESAQHIISRGSAPG